MKMITVELLGGGTVGINVEQVTWVQAHVAGSSAIHFTSGEQILAQKSVGDMTLELAGCEAR